jgi:hypothetical protein
MSTDLRRDASTPVEIPRRPSLPGAVPPRSVRDYERVASVLVAVSLRILHKRQEDSEC